MSRKRGQKQAAADQDELADEDDDEGQEEPPQLPELQGHQGDHEEQGEGHVADVVDGPLGDPDPSGQVVEVPEQGRREHRPDIGRQGEVEQREEAAQPGARPHGGQNDDRVLEQDIGALVLVLRGRGGDLGHLLLDDLLGRLRLGLRPPGAGPVSACAAR